MIESFSFTSRILYGVYISYICSLLEEMSMHIVIEALLLTIIMAPIMDSTLDPESSLQHAILYVMMYFSSVLQIICISVHILLVCAIIPVEEVLLQEWIATKLEAFTTAGHLHTRSYFSFLTCIVVWPILSITGDDPYYVRGICLFIFILFIALTAMPFGSVGIVGFILQPQLQVIICTLYSIIILLR